jgi:hypothetical protein
MNSLLDLGPLTEEVDIRGVKLTVRGLTAASLFKLFSEFPDMQPALAQMGTSNSAMLELAPDLFAKIIAIATGSPDDEAIIAKAKELGAADQMAILSAVQRLSFPQGFGPFVEQITRLMVPDTPSQPSGPGNSSPAPSNAALQTDSPGIARGASPRVN